MNLQKFEQALRSCVKKQFRKQITDKRALFEFIKQISTSTKHEIWKEVASATSQHTQLVHDYFHNSWSLQFYDDFHAHKEELKLLVAETMRLTDTSSGPVSKADLISRTVRAFAEKHPEKNFCTRRIRMFLDYRATKLVGAVQDGEEEDLARFLKSRFDLE